jgi:hypothetical protein
MNIEFHYYMTKYLALMAGFAGDEAEIIAYSSQYVDDNRIRYEIQKPDGSVYNNYITQTQNILEPKKKLIRIYLLYHFLPGDPTSYKARRRDGKMHVLITTPASNHAQEIFFDSTKFENLYSLGIASHMLADSVSHQNFVGNFDEINDMKGLWQTLVPNIGHASAGFKPDIPNLIWEDIRLTRENSIIDNKERTLLAAQKLYSNYLLMTSMPSKWANVKKVLSTVIGQNTDDKEIALFARQQSLRLKKLKEVLSEFDTEDFNPDKWFDQAVQTDVKFLNNKKVKLDPIKNKYTFKDNFENSHWYKFQQAVREFQKIASNKLEPILTQMEILEW